MPKGRAMTHRYAPMIDELLADRLIQAVMRADHVDPQSLRTLLDSAASRIAGRREHATCFVAKPFVEQWRLPWGAKAHGRAGAAPLADRCGSAFCC
jgi:hypothetical protein